MDKYTAGPWIFEYRDGNHPLNDQDRWGCDGLWALEGGFILGSGQGWDGEYCPPNEANARLIAAAPDLLDALVMVLDDPNALDGRPRTYEIVCAAIAKAKGEV